MPAFTVAASTRIFRTFRASSVLRRSRPTSSCFTDLHDLLHGLNGRIKDPVILRRVVPALAVDGVNETCPLAVDLFRKPARRVLIDLFPLHDPLRRASRGACTRIRHAKGMSFRRKLPPRPMITTLSFNA